MGANNSNGNGRIISSQSIIWGALILALSAIGWGVADWIGDFRTQLRTLHTESEKRDQAISEIRDQLGALDGKIRERIAIAEGQMTRIIDKLSALSEQTHALQLEQTEADRGKVKR